MAAPVYFPPDGSPLLALSLNAHFCRYRNTRSVNEHTKSIAFWVKHATLPDRRIPGISTGRFRCRMKFQAPATHHDRHPVRVDDDIEPLLIDVAGFERRLLQRQALVAGLVRDRGGLVVTDHRTERGHQH
jgi:hypothetical protein